MTDGTTTKHTPGPWLIVEKTDAKTISSWSIQVGEQALSFFPYVYQYGDAEKTCGGYVSNPEWHANARLIAAAPELLEALRGALKALDAIGDEMTVGERYTNAGQYLLDSLTPARAAIAKATGSTK